MVINARGKNRVKADDLYAAMLACIEDDEEEDEEEDELETPVQSKIDMA